MNTGETRYYFGAIIATICHQRVDKSDFGMSHERYQISLQHRQFQTNLGCLASLSLLSSSKGDGTLLVKVMGHISAMDDQSLCQM